MFNGNSSYNGSSSYGATVGNSAGPESPLDFPPPPWKFGLRVTDDRDDS